ncbi:hypothetical protein M9458_039779, partial [Cirrhinus mrigala]
MGLNTTTRTQLSREGPRESLAAYVEWVLDTSPTPDPVSSPTSPRSVEQQLEPTADGEQEPIATDEPSAKDATELRIATEPEPMTSDQVHEPATELATGENGEGSSAHRNIAEVNPESSVCPDLSACLDYPPTLTLLPHPLIPASAMPPLSPDSPFAHPQPTICAVGSPWVCQFPSPSWLEDPSSPPPAS